ncbi:uncharacterized protein LOC113797438 [Dermatophagoides pteronyssinus]|uniref:Uncharacterized protein LOC113797438 n=1 Tax=Dermatophagoides pteronyssinus TaxID=6956 RepID=A0A6P6YE99_DERPT|nr:uncharacterized protein LOC113797438 [Dermatophagoides pteronyssinus]
MIMFILKLRNCLEPLLIFIIFLAISISSLLLYLLLMIIIVMMNTTKTANKSFSWSSSSSSSYSPIRLSSISFIRMLIITCGVIMILAVLICLIHGYSKQKRRRRQNHYRSQRIINPLSLNYRYQPKQQQSNHNGPSSLIKVLTF